MSFAVGAAGDSAPQYFRDDCRSFSGAIDPMIGLLIERQALSMQGAKAGLISKERPTGHNHAARQ
jgi:hypothetical protein